MVVRTWIGSILLSCVGCVSVDKAFADGMRALRERQWQQSIQELEVFMRGGCPSTSTDARCPEARVAAAEAYLQLHEPKKAYVLLQNARWSEPQDHVSGERIDRLERMAHEEISSRLSRGFGTGRIGIRFSSQTRGRLLFRRLTLAVDLGLLRDQERGAGGATASMAIPPTEVPAGEHTLDVIAMYEGSGNVSPDYHFFVTSDEALVVSAGDLIDVQVRITEDPAWTSWRQALQVTIDVSHHREIRPETHTP